MCLFSGILKNPCLLIYVRLRFFLKFYRAKQTYFTKIAETRGFNYCLSALWPCRSSHLQMFFKIGVLKNFANFHMKTPVLSLFLIKISCEISEIFKNTCFNNTSGGCFWPCLYEVKAFSVYVRKVSFVSRKFQKFENPFSSRKFILNLQIKPFKMKILYLSV